MVDYSGDEIWGKCRQSLIVYLFSPQISPTKGKKQLPFLVKLLFFSVYSTAVQYFPCLRKHSKTCWKKKLKKNFVKAIASLSCLSGAVLNHFWYVYQHNYINLASLMGFTKPIRHYAESTHVKKKKILTFLSTFTALNCSGVTFDRLTTLTAKFCLVNKDYLFCENFALRYGKAN